MLTPCHQQRHALQQAMLRLCQEQQLPQRQASRMHRRLQQHPLPAQPMRSGLRKLPRATMQSRHLLWLSSVPSTSHWPRLQVTTPQEPSRSCCSEHHPPFRASRHQVLLESCLQVPSMTQLSGLVLLGPPRRLLLEFREMLAAAQHCQSPKAHRPLLQLSLTTVARPELVTRGWQQRWLRAARRMAACWQSRSFAAAQLQETMQLPAAWAQETTKKLLAALKRAFPSLMQHQSG